MFLIPTITDRKKILADISSRSSNIRRNRYRVPPYGFKNQIQAIGINIFGCFYTNNHILIPTVLFYENPLYATYPVTLVDVVQPILQPIRVLFQAGGQREYSAIGFLQWLCIHYSAEPLVRSALTGLNTSYALHPVKLLHPIGNALSSRYNFFAYASVFSVWIVLTNIRVYPECFFLLVKVMIAFSFNK